MKLCPKCGGSKLLAAVCVNHTWIFNEGRGSLQANDYSDIFRKPDDNDKWCCTRCGYKAKGAKFKEVPV